MNALHAVALLATLSIGVSVLAIAGAGVRRLIRAARAMRDYESR